MTTKGSLKASRCPFDCMGMQRHFRMQKKVLIYASVIAYKYLIFLWNGLSCRYHTASNFSDTLAVQMIFFVHHSSYQLADMYTFKWKLFRGKTLPLDFSDRFLWLKKALLCLSLVALGVDWTRKSEWWSSQSKCSARRKHHLCSWKKNFLLKS